MINPNKSGLGHIRRYHDPDDGVEQTDGRWGYTKWFGLRLKEGSIFRIGFGLCILMVAVLVAKAQLANRAAGLPSDALWFDLAFLGLIMAMSLTACIMFYCGSMTYRRQIREINAPMDRRDNAALKEVEEVERQTENTAKSAIAATHPCMCRGDHHTLPDFQYYLDIPLERHLALLRNADPGARIYDRLVVLPGRNRRHIQPAAESDALHRDLAARSE